MKSISILLEELDLDAELQDMEDEEAIQFLQKNKSMTVEEAKAYYRKLAKGKK